MKEENESLNQEVEQFSNLEEIRDFQQEENLPSNENNIQEDKVEENSEVNNENLANTQETLEIDTKIENENKETIDENNTHLGETTESNEINQNTEIDGNKTLDSEISNNAQEETLQIDKKDLFGPNKIVDSIDGFISLVKDDYDIESIYLSDRTLYKKLFKECHKRKKDQRFLLLEISLHLNNYIQEYTDRKVFKLLKKVKDKKNNYYLYYLGKMFLNGFGCKQDIIKAKKYFTQSSSFYLSVIELSKIALSEDDYSKSFKLIESITINNEKVLFQKAFLLQNGLGCNQELVSAFLIYNDLMINDFLPAFLPLSVCYLLGIGTKQDIKLGCEILQKGLVKGSKKCLIAEGICYLYGLNKKKDENKAKSIFVDLVDHQVYDACFFLALIKYNKKNAWSYQDAYDIFNYGQKHGSVICQIIIQKRYRKGLFGKMKIKKEFKKQFTLMQV